MCIKKIKRAAKREDERDNQPYSSDISWSIACDQPLIISAGGVSPPAERFEMSQRDLLRVWHYL